MLRLIGGFEQPDAGTVRLFSQDVTRLPPYRRDVNTVFQDYALFPHLSVLDNVAYPLTVRGVPVPERRRRAGEMLDLVQLTAFGSRRPAQLSGGQRQRVALARALAARPRLLLLDEPLGALDLKLREQMQTELRGLQRQLGLTFIYVTHDQGEAMSMSDRLAVFAAGRIEQEGTPHDLYESPRTAFVADFVGGANVLPGERLGRPGVRLALRPERIEVAARRTGRVAGKRPECSVSGCPDTAGTGGRRSDPARADSFGSGPAHHRRLCAACAGTPPPCACWSADVGACACGSPAQSWARRVHHVAAARAPAAVAGRRVPGQPARTAAVRFLQHRRLHGSGRSEVHLGHLRLPVHHAQQPRRDRQNPADERVCHAGLRGDRLSDCAVCGRCCVGEKKPCGCCW